MNTAFFLSGVAAATFLFAMVFFLKFWRTSRDSFYLWFSGACGLIGLERIVALFLHGTMEPIASEATEASSWVYLIRFAAFVIISVAILDKNRKTY